MIVFPHVDGPAGVVLQWLVLGLSGLTFLGAVAFMFWWMSRGPRS